MICTNCKIKMDKIKTDYKYVESGLPNLILKHISAFLCPKCREVYPIISHAENLHRLIAEKLITKNASLSGREFAFLRKEMGIKAKELSQIFGVHKVTVSKWETSKEPISTLADRLIRVLYRAKAYEDKCSLIKRTLLDKIQPSPALDSLEEFLKQCAFFKQMENDFLAIRKGRARDQLIQLPGAAVEQRLRFLGEQG